MIPRLSRAPISLRVTSAVALTLATFITGACQRVPLLAPSGSTITLTAAATVLPINGSADIIAQVVAASGVPPHSGTHLTFTTNLGSVQPSDAETDVNGKVVVRYVAGTSSGTATISAISGGVSVAATGVVKIAVGAAAVGAITLSANPGTVSAAGGSSTISATVLDTSGNALASVPVTFSSDAGSINPSVANTDQSGRATTTLTTNRTAKVTGQAGIAGSTTGTGGTTTTAAPTSTITVTVNATQAITAGTPTPAAPGVGQTVSIPLTYAAASAGGSPIVSVRVDWGDGSAPRTVSGQPPAVSHAYGSPGSFLVTITGVDALGDPSTASASVTVVNSQPSVGITVNNDNPVAGTAVTFTVTASIPGNPTGVAIQDIFVLYGDGGGGDIGSTSGSITHTYLAAGNYIATATATSTNGQSTSRSVSLQVR